MRICWSTKILIYVVVFQIHLTPECVSCPLRRRSFLHVQRCGTQRAEAHGELWSAARHWKTAEQRWQEEEHHTAEICGWVLIHTSDSLSYSTRLRLCNDISQEDLFNSSFMRMRKRARFYCNSHLGTVSMIFTSSRVVRALLQYFFVDFCHLSKKTLIGLFNSILQE